MPTMKAIVLFSLCVAAATALPRAVVYEKGIAAADCTPEVCVAADGCRCASSSSPIASDQTPQLVSLTFEDAVTEDLYHDYWQPILYERVNPDGAKIGATFFVPHEYTDYQKVNSLYNYGFEIAVDSISKNSLQQYWREASEEVLDQEFGGQKTILAKFANIAQEDIVGVRTPQLQIAGNVTIDAYVDSGFQYDSDWPTLPKTPLFPYTLDYKSTQQCTLASFCPNEAFKGFWVLPINEINGTDNACNNIAACGVTGSTDDIANWLVGEVNKFRLGSRAPLTLLVSPAWFKATDNALEGFVKFLDTLATYEDVFLVSQKQVLDWSKNPVPLSDFETEVTERSTSCVSYTCALKKTNGEERYMRSCVACPSVYPWLGNPEGNEQ